MWAYSGQQHYSNNSWATTETTLKFRKRHQCPVNYLSESLKFQICIIFQGLEVEIHRPFETMPKQFHQLKNKKKLES